MYIFKLSADAWDGIYNHETEVSNPTRYDVETSIRNLDGKTRTTVMLETGGIAYMSISGGDENKYIVSVRNPDSSYFILTSHINNAKDTKVWMNIGGQMAEYPARWCSDLAQSLLAAQIYATDGSLAPTLTWERL